MSLIAYDFCFVEGAVRKPDYQFHASVIIACEGPEPGTLRGSPTGLRRMRDGAELQKVASDAE